MKELKTHPRVPREAKKMLTGSHLRVCLLCIGSGQAGLPQNSGRLVPGLSSPGPHLPVPPQRGAQAAPTPITTLSSLSAALTPPCPWTRVKDNSLKHEPWRTRGMTRKSLTWMRRQPSRRKYRWPGKRVHACANPVCELLCTACCRSHFHANSTVWAHLARAHVHPHPHTPLV